VINRDLPASRWVNHLIAKSIFGFGERSGASGIRPVDCSAAWRKL
jgi:hypothetical protein